MYEILMNTLNYKLVKIGDGYTVIRSKDNKGLVLYNGDSGKYWAQRLKISGSIALEKAMDYEFKSSDELIDYSE